MRRRDRAAAERQALEFIDRCPYAVISLVTPDGEAYGVPLSIVREGHSLYFHCAFQGKKIEALEKNPRVSIVCVSHVQPRCDDFSTEFESAIVSGTARRITDRARKVEVLRALCLRYTPAYMDHFDQAVARSIDRTDVWEVPIETLAGKQKKYDEEGREIKAALT